MDIGREEEGREGEGRGGEGRKVEDDSKRKLTRYREEEVKEEIEEVVIEIAIVIQSGRQGMICDLKYFHILLCLHVLHSRLLSHHFLQPLIPFFLSSLHFAFHYSSIHFFSSNSANI